METSFLSERIDTDRAQSVGDLGVSSTDRRDVAS